MRRSSGLRWRRSQPLWFQPVEHGHQRTGVEAAQVGHFLLRQISVAGDGQ